MKQVLVQQRRDLRAALTLILVCTLLGVLYPVLAREFDDPIAFLNGFLIGFIGGIFISFFELHRYKPGKRKMRFFHKLITKSLTYTLFFSGLVLMTTSFTRSLEQGTGFLAYLAGPDFYRFVFEGDFHIIILYTLFLSATVSFTRQMSRKMGQGVFVNFISGKYLRPREEERIFMFMDLNSSTTIAENLGEVRYHDLLNDYFFDVTGSILSTKGEIYRYVGDEVVVFWDMAAGLKNANCIRTFFYALQEVRRQSEKYLEKYGLIPTFSAGFHSGRVIRGEIGDVKSQIVFLGDVMYTAARAEKQCSALGVPILITSALMEQLTLPEIYEKEQVGILEAMDRQKAQELYTLQEIDIRSV